MEKLLVPLKKLLENGELMECEFVCSYILIWNQTFHSFVLGAKRQNPKSLPSKASARIKSPLFCCHKLHEHQFTSNCSGERDSWGTEFPFSRVPGINFSERELNRLGEVGAKSVLDIFRHFLLRQTPSFVNDCLLEWRAGNRPFLLRFHIPSPQEVWKMMIGGSRCLTIFVDAENLAKTFKDEYPPFKARNALEFMYHDLQHMERFVESYEEQIGFFSLFPFDRVLQFFSNDPLLQQDIIHLLADMNAPCILLFRFFRSKWMESICREKGKKRLDDAEFSSFLQNVAETIDDWIGTRDLHNIFLKPEMSLEESNVFRSFFAKKNKTNTN